MSEDLFDAREVGRKLHDHRRGQRTTQEEIAGKLAISRPGVAAIEAGRGP